MSDPVAILLAAGKSTRMKSDVPKVLHEICGRPMIEYVLDAVRAAGVRRIVAVIGHQADLVRQALAGHGDVEFALQTEQKGTGHAVMKCAEALSGHDGPVLVLAGDTPLLRSESLTGLLDELCRNEAACVIGTAVTEANQGLGRVVRDERGNFVRIVEQKDATPQEAAIREINTGCYAFGAHELFDSLRRVQPNGLLGNTNNPTEAARYMYGQGFGTLFLACVYGEEDRPQRRKELEKVLTKAVEFIGHAQTDRGGWGYVSAKEGGNFDEGSVTITQLQALRAARDAGIVVPKSIIDKAVKYLKDSTTQRGGIIYSLTHGAPAIVPDYGGVASAIEAQGQVAGLRFKAWDSGDLAATIYRHMEVPLDAHYEDNRGRPHPIVQENGQPIRELF